MSIEIVEGNIFNCDEDVIVHQTNCQGVMGHGIALQIKQRFPEVFELYKNYCNQYKPDKLNYLLGTAYICPTASNKYIANVFGQLNYGEGLQTDYVKLENGLSEVRDFAEKYEYSVAIPYKIGCGLAHGNWNVVEQIINRVFKEVPCKIYRYEVTSTSYNK